MNYNKLCVVKLFLIDLNSFELKYYLFITRLDKLNESINFVDDLCTIIWLPSKTKDMNVKVFNIIRNRTEKIYIGQTYFTWLLQVSIQITDKNVCNWNLSTFICENGKYLSIYVLPMIQIFWVMKLRMLWVLY